MRIEQRIRGRQSRCCRRWSPRLADPKPVFEVIVRHACDLCDGYGASLAQVVDSSIVLRAYIVADEALGKRHEAGFPRPVSADTIFGRAILAREPVQIPDVAADETFALRESTLRSAVRALVAVPLMRDGEAIGAIDISRRQTGEFSHAQIELLQVLANQAVIAINSAEMHRELQTRTADLQETLEYQTATGDVLKVISSSGFELEPVFQTVVDTAARLCRADQAVIFRLRDDAFRWAAGTDMLPEFERRMRTSVVRPGTGSLIGRVALQGRPVQILDRWTDPLSSPEAKDSARIGGVRSALGVPLVRDGVTIGAMGLNRLRVEAFTERQIELVSTFADQAVIAIENARLITEQREALEQQTATAEVLQVINASPGNLAPVFDVMLEKAMRLCGGTIGGIFTFDGDHSVTSAVRGVTAAFQEYNDKYPMDKIQPGTVPARIIETRGPVQTPDLAAGEGYRAGYPYARALVELGGIRAVLAVPLLKDGVAIGMVAIYRQEPGAFTDKQIALLQNFSAQAVIAMENARLLTETREALEQQTATAEVLQVINSSPGNLAPVFDAMLEKALRLCEAAFGIINTYDGELFHPVSMRSPPALADTFRSAPNLPRASRHSGLRHIVLGEDVVQIEDLATDPVYQEGEARRVIEAAGAHSYLGVALRLEGKLLGAIGTYRQEVRPFTDKQIALLQNFAAQAVIAMENARLLGELRTARDAAEASLQQLKAAQANLIQAEKMASLGQLTAGIAHEIKNPLNFVNNFAELSGDLLNELNDAVAGSRQAEIDELTVTLQGNLAKITEHGKRADGIVKAMLEHSRGTSGERRAVDLNALVDEALNLAYHGARAQDQSFNVTLERDFATGIAPIELTPQDVTRVLLNLFSNGFYATRKRQNDATERGFEPTLKVTTRDLGDAVEIRVRDNGVGVPANIRDKLFQPFFTTKPTGEGTGLGLSISYDIVTKQHSGTITVESEPNSFTEFAVTIPRGVAA